MRKLEIENNEVVKIANFFDIQVVGKMAIYKSDIFGYIEKDVITDIAFLDASGNVIVKRSDLGINLAITYNEYLSDKLEAICYFLARKTYDSIDLENIINGLIDNNMELLNHKMHQEIKKEEKHNAMMVTIAEAEKKYKTLENELTENEILFYTDGKLYQVKFNTSEAKKKFEAMYISIQKEILDNINNFSDCMEIIKTYYCDLCMYQGNWYYSRL